jgi:hypothetical protein
MIHQVATPEMAPAAPRQALAMLAARLHGTLVRPGDADYATALHGTPILNPERTRPRVACTGVWRWWELCVVRVPAAAHTGERSGYATGQGSQRRSTWNAEAIDCHRRCGRIRQRAKEENYDRIWHDRDAPGVSL